MHKLGAWWVRYAFLLLVKRTNCGEPAISQHSYHVSLVQGTTYLLPVMRDPGSIPRGVLTWNWDSSVSVVSLHNWNSGMCNGVADHNWWVEEKSATLYPGWNFGDFLHVPANSIQCLQYCTIEVKNRDICLAKLHVKATGITVCVYY